MSDAIGLRSDKGVHPFDRKWVRNMTCAILEAAGVGHAELSVYFCSVQTMQNLNRDWRGKDSPTDVLSFSQTEDGQEYIEGEPLGDLVLSTDVAASQALREGVSFESELIRLLIHGVLHLLGYDHEQGKADALRMRREEKRIFGQMEAMCAGIEAAKK
jgi:probable rRNA maturation factor